jgi:hypothetical protein
MKKVSFLILMAVLFTASHVHAQSIGVNTNTPDPSAALDVNSTTQGLLAPRMTDVQRLAIPSPATGLLVYQTNGTKGLYQYDGSNWLPVGSVGGANTQVIYNNNGAAAGSSNLTWNNGTNTLSTTNMQITGLGGSGTRVVTTDNNGLLSATTLSSGVTGSGTINFHPKFTAATVLGNSLIQDNGTSLSVGLTAPSVIYQLYVYRQQLTVNGDGQHSLFGYRTRDSQNDGISYAQIGVNSATEGFNFWGDLYTFGISGHNYNDYSRTGGTLGADVNGAYWGSLGYRNSGLINYGVYGSSAYASGSGYMANNQYTGIGGGFYGGVMGGWVRGEVLGLTAAGEAYASYNVGNEYTSGHQADIVTTNNARKVAYSQTSTTLKISDDGYGQLVNGQAVVVYSEGFQSMLASSSRPVISLTAVGKPVALYVSTIDANGFTVAAVDGSTVNVEFSWTSTAKRVDAIDADAPAMLLDAQFDEHLKGAMFDDGKLDQSGKYLWWDGLQLRFDAPPAQVINK